MTWVSGTGDDPARGARSRGDAGVGLVDVMIGLTILAFVTATLLSIFLSGITQARTSGLRAEATTWAQSQIDYLRYQGVTSPCLTAGIRTITPVSPVCAALEPALPADLATATVQVETNALGQAGLRRITIQVSHVPGTVFYQVVTYETQFL